MQSFSFLLGPDLLFALTTLCGNVSLQIRAIKQAQNDANLPISANLSVSISANVILTVYPTYRGGGSTSQQQIQVQM